MSVMTTPPAIHAPADIDYARQIEDEAREARFVDRVFARIERRRKHRRLGLIAREWARAQDGYNAYLTARMDDPDGVDREAGMEVGDRAYTLSETIEGLAKDVAGEDCQGIVIDGVIVIFPNSLNNGVGGEESMHRIDPAALLTV